MKNKQKKSRPSLLSLCRCGGRVGRAACQPIWERTSSVEPPTADKSSLLGADFLLVHRPTWNSAATLKPFTVTSCSDNVSWRRLVSPRCSVLSSGHLAKTFLVFFPQIIQHQLTLCDISDYNQQSKTQTLHRDLGTGARFCTSLSDKRL